MSSLAEQRVNYLGYTQSMWRELLVKLGENDIKSLEEFAGLTTDDLIGYFEDKSDKNTKINGLLEEFNITKDEGDQLIMEARKIWLEQSYIEVILPCQIKEMKVQKIRP